MPSAAVYADRRTRMECPRCGRRMRKGRGKGIGRGQGREKPDSVPVLCQLHKKMAREEKRRAYQKKVNSKQCVWSGCHDAAEPKRRMCAKHLAKNREKKCSVDVAAKSLSEKALPSSARPTAPLKPTPEVASEQ